MTEPRPIPYPSETRSKGWRFELDLEKIHNSDTWDLAAEIPMAQHALLMMWSISWTQEPCGSMPADPDLIRAKLKIPRKLWDSMRDIVLRGWWLASDGRLYHDVIVTRVEAMLEKREKDRLRTRNSRANRSASRDGHIDVTRDTNVTPPAVTGEFDTKHQNQIPEPDTAPPPPTDLEAGAPGEAPVGVVDGFEPTPAGAVCKALRAIGISRTNPGHPTLKELLKAGATVEEFMGLASQAMGKNDPFAWLLQALVSQRLKAAELATQLANTPKPAARSTVRAANHGAHDVEEPA